MYFQFEQELLSSQCEQVLCVGRVQVEGKPV